MDHRGRIEKAELARPRVDDFAAEGVQRVDGQVRCASVELAADFVTQPARGFGGGGDHQDARGISSFPPTQVSDTSRESRGLPAAWTGNDAKWPVAGGDGGLLGGREAIVHPAWPRRMIAAKSSLRARG